MAQCQYSTSYYDSADNLTKLFYCNQPASSTSQGLCIFHDRNYYEENASQIVKSLMAVIRQNSREHTPLLLIGYNLPDISFELAEVGEIINDVYFLGTQFHGSVSFTNTRFGGIVDFSNAIFSGTADFTNALFNGTANFSYSLFERDVNFSRTLFSDANFYSITFKGKLTFYGSTFSNKAHFSNIAFNNNVDFSTTIFSDNADFSGSFFGDLAEFVDTNFLNAYFDNCNFAGIVNFKDAIFSIARFTRTQFSESALFSGARFDSANFSESIFKDVDFHHSTFEEARFYSTQFDEFASFRDVLFVTGNKTSFDFDDLSNVSFLNTNLSGVRFGEDVSWGVTWQIIDERLLQSGLESERRHTNLSSVRRIYRQLRRNYEDSDKYEEADIFYLREMELNRRYRDAYEKGNRRAERTGYIKRNFSLTGLYYHLSYYGLNVKRPLIIGMVFLFFIIVFKLVEINPSLYPSFTIEGLSYLGIAFQNFLTDIFGVKQTELEGSIIRFLTIPFLGSLIIAAVRKSFYRKFKR